MGLMKIFQYVIIFSLVEGQVPFFGVKNIDVSFVLQASEIISPLYFSRQIRLVKDLAIVLGINQNGTRGSVVLLSNNGIKAVYCDENQNERSFIRAVDQLRQSGNITNYEDGIQVAKHLLETRGCGTRSGVNKIIIVLTDGKINNNTKPNKNLTKFAEISQSVRNSGINIFALTVKRNVNNNFLQALTNNSQHIIRANYINQLGSILFLKQILIGILNSEPAAVQTTPLSYVSTTAVLNDVPITFQTTNSETDISTKQTLEETTPDKETTTEQQVETTTQSTGEETTPSVASTDNPISLQTTESVTDAATEEVETTTESTGQETATISLQTTESTTDTTTEQQVETTTESTGKETTPSVASTDSLICLQTTESATDATTEKVETNTESTGPETTTISLQTTESATDATTEQHVESTTESAGQETTTISLKTTETATDATTEKVETTTESTGPETTPSVASTDNPISLQTTESVTDAATGKVETTTESTGQETTTISLQTTESATDATKKQHVESTTESTGQETTVFVTSQTTDSVTDDVTGQHVKTTTQYLPTVSSIVNFTTLQTTLTSVYTTKNAFSFCRCNLDISKFSSIEFTEAEVELTFNGSSLKDKLTEATNYVLRLMKAINSTKYQFGTCKNAIKSYILIINDGKCVDMLFERFTECVVNIDCYLKDFYIRAVNSKKNLEDQIIKSEKNAESLSGFNKFMHIVGW